MTAHDWLDPAGPLTDRQRHRERATHRAMAAGAETLCAMRGRCCCADRRCREAIRRGILEQRVKLSRVGVGVIEMRREDWERLKTNLAEWRRDADVTFSGKVVV